LAVLEPANVVNVVSYVRCLLLLIAHSGGIN
jgi:hypothetical protein